MPEFFFQYTRHDTETVITEKLVTACVEADTREEARERLLGGLGTDCHTYGYRQISQELLDVTYINAIDAEARHRDAIVDLDGPPSEDET